MSCFLQPLIFWQTNPPPLCITSAFISRSRNRLVTGCARGSLILWELQCSEADLLSTTVYPHIIVVGTTSGVVDLAEAISDTGSIVCALTDHGSVFICDLQDGACRGIMKEVVHEASAISSLPGLRHVLVAGSAKTMVILDVVNHSKTCSLQTYGLVVGLPPSLHDWASPLIAPEHSEVVSISSDKYLQYWDISSALKASDKAFPVKSILVDVGDGYPCSCDQNASGTLILVVCSSRWMLYLHHEDRPFYTMVVDDIYLSGGCFVKATQLAIYTAEGDIWLYLLPKKLLELAAEHRRNPEESAKSSEVQKMLTSLLPTKTVKKGKMKGKFKNVRNVLNTMKSKLHEPNLTTKLPRDKGPVKWASKFKAIGRESKDSLLRPLSSPEKLPEVDASGDVPGKVAPVLRPESTAYRAGARSSFDKGHGSAASVKKKLFIGARSAMHAINMLKSSRTPMKAEAAAFLGRMEAEQPAATEAAQGPAGDDFPSSSFETLDEDTTSSKEPKDLDTGMDSDGDEGNDLDRGVEPLLVQTVEPGTIEREYLAVSCPTSLDSILFMRASSSHVELYGGENSGTPVRQLCHSTLAKSWQALSSPTVDDSKFDGVKNTVFDMDTGCMVQAYNSGHVVVHDPVTGSRNGWLAHSSGIVCMLFKGQQLITGGRMGAVKAWDHLSGTLHQVFHWHTDQVEHLLVPPPEVGQRTGSQLCSVGRDGAIVFYCLFGEMEVRQVFPGHHSGVERIYWVTERDLMLVRCGDGSLFVWDIASAQLDRVVPGTEAEATLGHLQPKEAVLQETQPAEVPAGPGRLLQFQSCFSETGEPHPLLVADMRVLIAMIKAEAETQRPKGKNGVGKSLSGQCLLPPSPRKGNGGPSQNSLDTDLDAFSRAEASDALQFQLSRPVVSILAYLLQPDKGPAVDKLREVFRIPAKPIHPPATYGFNAYASTLSLLAPHTDSLAIYAVSPTWTALRLLTVAAVLHALLSFNTTELRPLVQDCMHHCLVQQPKRIPGYQPPSFQWCIQWLGDSCADIRIGAQLTMNAIVRLLKPPELATLCSGLLETCDSSQAHQNPASVIALCMICVQAPTRVPPRALPSATQGLLRLVEYGGSMHCVAIGLLAEHLPTWRPHIPEMVHIMQRLYDLAIPDRPEGSQATKEGDHELVHAAEIALVACGVLQPQTFFDFIEATLHTLSPQRQHGTVLCIARLMRRDRLQLYPCLPRVVNVILGVLDPHQIAVHNLCLPAVTSVLGIAVRYYNMVAFEQVKQKLAVGYQTGDVVLYDLRTASRYLHFSAHSKTISCLQFSPDGKRLATFCSDEGIVKVWQFDSSHRKPKLTFVVKNNKRYISLEDVLQNLRFKWVEERQLQLYGADAEQLMIAFTV
eukprot:EG_transcript_523